MLRKTFIGSAVLTLVLAANAAHAGVVFNSGTPDNLGDPILVDSNDWLAGQVTFSQGYQISEIKAYLEDLGSTGSAFSISLYSNTSANKVGKQLFTTDVTLSSNGWNGASNLGWTIDSGTYWVGLEVSDAQGSSLDAPQYANAGSFVRTAVANGNGYTSYQTATPYQFGLQISAAPVPEPTGVAMMLAGMALVGSMVKRRNANQV